MDANNCCEIGRTNQSGWAEPPTTGGASSDGASYGGALSHFFEDVGVARRFDV